jgi:hypothetical protein
MWGNLFLFKIQSNLFLFCELTLSQSLFDNISINVNGFDLYLNRTSIPSEKETHKQLQQTVASAAMVWRKSLRIPRGEKETFQGKRQLTGLLKGQ